MDTKKKILDLLMTLQVGHDMRRTYEEERYEATEKILELVEEEKKKAFDEGYNADR